MRGICKRCQAPAEPRGELCGECQVAQDKRDRTRAMEITAHREAMQYEKEHREKPCYLCLCRPKVRSMEVCLECYDLWRLRLLGVNKKHTDR